MHTFAAPHDRLLSRALLSYSVYPGAFIAKGYVEFAPGFYTETRQVHLGESWKHGYLILSWDDVLANASDIHDGQNVALHEFAHNWTRTFAGKSKVGLYCEPPIQELHARVVAVGVVVEIVRDPRIYRS